MRGEERRRGVRGQTSGARVRSRSSGFEAIFDFLVFLGLLESGKRGKIEGEEEERTRSL